jgi:hypothetical protein
MKTIITIEEGKITIENDNGEITEVTTRGGGGKQPPPPPTP